MFDWGHFWLAQLTEQHSGCQQVLLTSHKTAERGNNSADFGFVTVVSAPLQYEGPVEMCSILRFLKTQTFNLNEHGWTQILQAPSFAQRSPRAAVFHHAQRKPTLLCVATDSQSLIYSRNWPRY